MTHSIATSGKKYRLAVRLFAVGLLGSLVGGCVTTGTGSAVQCGAFRRISFSASKDTPLTIKQIRIQNRVMDKLGCPR